MIKEFTPTSTVGNLQVITRKGTWETKSGGILSVMFALSQDELMQFLDYGNPEFDEILRSSGHDIRGLRSYSVRGIPKGSIGANEWHRARTECVIALAGSAMWRCIDLQGQEREVVLDSTNAVITPPDILHTYQALEDGTSLQVICNTLFIPDDPSTHDSYSKAQFDALSAQ
jgi:hypothetical protein